MNADMQPITPRKRLAIVGAGSSGLICLKHAIELLRDWDIVCFEKSDRFVGCWGNPHKGFVSTSTKYTTQFACFQKFTAETHADGGRSRAEFFRDNEYGRYLEEFAERFELLPFITPLRSVRCMQRNADASWQLFTIDHGNDNRALPGQRFDAVILCTGLAARSKEVDCLVPQLTAAELNQVGYLETVTNQTVVVLGGGESAVDFANRLAREELNNRVVLSLHSGIRVSPRYHPIRGVPSDFLRNRLMLSIHEDLRNWIGERFVRARIRKQEQFERWFPQKRNSRSDVPTSPGLDSRPASAEYSQRRSQWAFRLTKAAKDDLFNMFHNKSDDFLDAVAAGRIEIVGPSMDERFAEFASFDTEASPAAIDVDLVVPAVGFQACLPEVSGGRLEMEEFFLGCCHQEFTNLFLVGFARPIIGNIPSISEMQSRYVCGLLAGIYARPADLQKVHRQDVLRRKERFQALNLNAVYPVEMFPYCDRLARLMGTFPSLRAIGSIRHWWRIQIAPATTIHYLDDHSRAIDECKRAHVYLPKRLILLLLALKPLDWIYRLVRRFRTG